MCIYQQITGIIFKKTVYGLVLTVNYKAIKKDTYRVIIVDDEEKARKNISNELKKYHDIQIVAEASNANEAIKRISEFHPDIVFLDVKLTETNGFEILDMLKKKQLTDFEIIFFSAYHNYAIKAIKYAAFDYLLKPIDPDELDTTLNKFREKQNSSNNLNIEALKEIFNPCPKLRVLSGNNFKYININEIFYIEGDGAYSHFYLTYTNDKITACRNLKYFEEELAGCNFLRIHKTYIINKRYLSSYNRKTRFCILEYPGKKKELQVSQRMEKNIVI